MKYLFYIAIYILVQLMIVVAFASDRIELLGPGQTFSVMSTGGTDRFYYTQQIGLKKTNITNNVYNSLSLTYANQVYGLIGGTGIQMMHMLNTGIIYGFFVQNNNDLRAAGIAPDSMTDGSNAIVPIFGLEINAHFDTTDNTFIGWNNIISPLMVRSSLSFGLRY